MLTNRHRPPSADQSGINASGTGVDGTTNGAYVQLTATLPAGTNAIRVRYTTDGGLALPGLLIDDIAINGTPVGTAEADEGWTFNGFRRTTGTETSVHFNAYVGEYRNYRGNDTSLATAYNFGFLDARPDWVETHPYMPGLLLTYWDESFGDNNVGDHPGGGRSSRSTLTRRSSTRTTGTSCARGSSRTTRPSGSSRRSRSRSTRTASRPRSRPRRPFRHSTT